MISKVIYSLALKPYRFINLCFISILTGVFAYSYLASPSGKWTINCWYYTRYHVLCPSCGLTRAFHALCTGRLHEALLFNRGALWIASFFMLQLFMRAGGCIADGYAKQIQPFVYADILLSVFSLFLCFGKGYGLF